MLLTLHLNELLGPVETGSSSSSAAGGSSSAQASSAAACQDTVVSVTLVSLGGTGCGIEVTNGIAYSIGSQLIGATFSDPNGSIAGVYINGILAPALVSDGDVINVTVTPAGVYTNCGQSGPVCVKPLFMGMIPSFGGTRLKIDKMELLRRVQRAKKRQLR